MSQYDSFYNSKGKSKGCVLLAITHDPHQHTNLHIYYMGEDGHVGVVSQGISCWVSPIDTALYMFRKGELAELIEKAKRGEHIEVEEPVTDRKKLEVTVESPTLQRKMLLKRREVTNG